MKWLKILKKHCVTCLGQQTPPGNESLLLAYVRFVKDESLVQELLFARQLETDTKGESVFRVVDDFFKEKDIPLCNILACATDGAPSMVGRHRGFISFLEKSCTWSTYSALCNPQAASGRKKPEW